MEDRFSQLHKNIQSTKTKIFGEPELAGVKTRVSYFVGDIPLGSKVKVIKTDFNPDKNGHRIVMIECLKCKHRRLVRVTNFSSKNNPYKRGCGRCQYKTEFAIEKELKTKLCDEYHLTKEDYLNVPNIGGQERKIKCFILVHLKIGMMH